MSAQAEPLQPEPLRTGKGELPARHAGLMSSIGGLRLRGSKLPVETILLITASILLPLGLVLILLGWYGAAHTGRLYAQIDYMISGGLLGLGLSIAGGFMYFGYWLSRQLGESRRQASQELETLRRLERLLEASAKSAAATTASGTTTSGRTTSGRTAGGGALPVDPPAGPASPTRNGRPARRRVTAGDDTPAGGVPILVATAQGSLLHRPDCQVVAKRDGLRMVAPGTEGFGYCTMCDAAGVLT